MILDRLVAEAIVLAGGDMSAWIFAAIGWGGFIAMLLIHNADILPHWGGLF